MGSSEVRGETRGEDRGGTSETARDAERIREEASVLFAEYVAERADGELVDFEEWVKAHPLHESELRLLHEHWSTFERGIEHLHAGGPVEVPVDEPGADDVIGGYRLLDVLGEGAMGRVWRAQQLSSGREVALKLMLRKRQHARGLAFFEREWRAASRVEHPNVVKALGTGEEEGVRWIASELIPGGRTMAGFLDVARRQERLPSGYFTHVARLFARVADGLHVVHEAGVIHRDLKPKNILLAPDGSPKVTDFGLARVAGEEPLSRTGDFVGTFNYMSPEQITARRIGIDHRTDVFSLGVVLYEALTRQLPFRAHSDYDVAEKILYEDPGDPHTVDRQVPEGLAWICAKALEKRRGDRFATMAEMRDELLRFSERKPIFTRPAGVARRVRRHVTRRPVRSALVGLAAVSLFVVLALLDVVAAARGDAQESAYHGQLSALQTAVHVGDLARAADHAAQAAAIRPGDPEPHLLMATVDAAFDLWPEMRQEIEAAERKGFRRSAGPGATAADHLHEALAILAREGRPGHERARAALERALEQDPMLAAAHFLRFRLCAAQDDDACARAALRDFRGFLTEAWTPEFRRMVDALDLEHQGRYDEALLVLEELAADEAPAGDWRGPRLARSLGRICLRDGRYEEARAHLEAAVLEEPRDLDSRTNLAEALRALAIDAPEEEATELLALAEEQAAAALAIYPGDPSARSIDARITVASLQFSPRVADCQVALTKLGAAVGASDEESEERAKLLALEPAVHVRKGHLLLDAQSYAEAAAALRAGLERDPGHAPARWLLAQALWMSNDFEGALGELDRALDLLAEEGEAARRGWPDSLRADLHVWVLWSAARLELADRCEASLEIVEAELARGVEPRIAELVTYAEFLATSPLSQFVDCERVQELFDQHGIRAALRADPLLEERCRGVVAAIDAACF